MSETTRPPELDEFSAWPDHTQLPESDGSFVKNFQEHPQSILLTDSLTPVLEPLHPDGNYAIGQDCGIYWRYTDPPEQGVVAPDWFYVPNVPPLLEGATRRSFVLWKELAAPLIVLEFASGDGKEEHDATALSRETADTTSKPGKFWIYERAIRIPYYGIYQIKNSLLTMYHLRDFAYQRMSPNQRGHYPIAPLQVELGVWEGEYLGQHTNWLRWWDQQGNLLAIGQERARSAEQRAHSAEQRASKLAARLRALGVNPDEIE